MQSLVFLFQWEPLKPHEAANVKPRPVKRGRTTRAPAVSSDKLAQVINRYKITLNPAKPNEIKIRKYVINLTQILLYHS